jgi:hypothetical protein
MSPAFYIPDPNQAGPITQVKGCTNSNAYNYNQTATIDD